MPFTSKKQRAFMYANHPTIAKRWSKEAKKAGKPNIQPKKRRRK